MYVLDNEEVEFDNSDDIIFEEYHSLLEGFDMSI